MRRRGFLCSGMGLLAASGAAAAAKPSPGFTVAADALLRAYQALVEEHLSGCLRGLRGLSRTSEAASGDWATIRPAVYQTGADSPTYATIWYAKADGGYFSVSTDSLADISIAGEPYFSELMGGDDVHGEVVV